VQRFNVRRIVILRYGAKLFSPHAARHAGKPATILSKIDAMKITSSFLFVLGFTALAASYSTVRAQVPASVLEGVYTDAQAKRGAAVYKESCEPCHGAKLTGTDAGGPTLVGADFISGWKDMSLGALLNKVNMDMPSNAPGTLTPEQYADVLAYVLSVNKYPAGAKELPTDAVALKPVKMAAPPK
jgi:mono/diheme cytochrome c family protein